jgi:hypothetical protein
MYEEEIAMVFKGNAKEESPNNSNTNKNRFFKIFQNPHGQAI